jgi:hypothetical protein
MDVYPFSLLRSTFVPLDGGLAYRAVAGTLQS